jgi:hypothetical protein
MLLEDNDNLRTAISEPTSHKKKCKKTAIENMGATYRSYDS